MKINYYALGCKVNEYETVAVINRFLDNGYTLVDFHEESDVCIINTCTVTKTADVKSRKIIRQAIRRNPHALIAVMGCFSQLNSDEVAAIPGVHVVIGTRDRHILYELIKKALKENKPFYNVQERKNIREYEELKLSKYTSRTRGFVKIEDGCDNFCSYCAIPYARGRVRSRRPADVLSEITFLTNEGFKEIVLTGINTAAYGADFLNYSFSDLMDDIFTGVPGLGRIRISSIEITEITDKLLAVLKKHENHFCRHLHIPLQGGTDSVLKRMNRKYDTYYYEKKIKKIRNLFPYINITTDIMTGFPGENTDEFSSACAFIKNMAFGETHVFPYSGRPQTKAYAFSDQTNAREKKARVRQLLELNGEQARRYREQFVGKTLEVLVEKIKDGRAYGHSDNYINVVFSVKGALVNEVYPVRIKEAGYPLSGGDYVI